MTVKLGLFTMPFHHPARDYATILEPKLWRESMELLATEVIPRLSQHAAAGAPPGSGAAAGRARGEAR